MTQRCSVATAVPHNNDITSCNSSASTHCNNNVARPPQRATTIALQQHRHRCSNLSRHSTIVAAVPRHD
ncbi:unnamed protein product [Sphagnum jensenii]|uniref:Uncharacterized protein n=1 Tax=Sphagnum jensenii TaxID=128206 RepID=A0ABP1AG13_9BRYO